MLQTRDIRHWSDPRRWIKSEMYDCGDGGSGSGGGGGCIEFPLQYLSLYILIWILSIPVLRWLFVLIGNLIDLNILLEFIHLQLFIYDDQNKVYFLSLQFLILNNTLILVVFCQLVLIDDEYFSPQVCNFTLTSFACRLCTSIFAM